MLPRHRLVRFAVRQNVNNDSRYSARVCQKRHHSMSTAALPMPDNPKLSYLRNPGTRPLLETTIGKLLETAAERWPRRDGVISIHQNSRLTYGELLLRADKLAAGLKKLGLRKGDRIGIWGPNQIEWIVSYMGAARAGLIVAGINPYYQLGELHYCLKKIGARAVIAPESYRTQKYAEMLLTAKKNLPMLEHIIVCADDHVTGTRRFRDVETLADRKDVEMVKEEQVEISPYSGTNIQFTSGTTGNPKAVLLSQRGLANNARQAVTRLDTDGRKICLNVPFFHAFGMVMGIVAPLHAGSTVVLESPTFNPVKSIEAVLAEKCEVCFGTPTMWTNMIDVQTRTGAKIDTLYTGSIGGAPASPDLYRRVRQCLRMERIKGIYGLTENTAIVNQSLPEEDNQLTETTIGYISDHLEIKVVDEKGDMVPFGTPGELCTRGYSTMLGYWDDEENTRKTITEDEWLKTGDQYVLREDGYGIIVGRLKDMIIRGGENIYPKEIEHFLESHPSILEVHAFGVHDDVYGEEMCACVRLRSGAKLSAEDVVNYANGKIAKFKIPKYIVFREEFPKTTSGKIQKFKLRQEMEDQGIVPKATQS